MPTLGRRGSLYQGKGLESYYRHTHWEVAPEIYKRGVAGYVSQSMRWQRELNARVRMTRRSVERETAFELEHGVGLFSKAALRRVPIQDRWRFNRVLQGVADPELWRLAHVVDIPGAKEVLRRKGSPFVSGGGLDPTKVWDPLKEIAGLAEKAGLSLATSRADDIIAGRASILRPEQINVAGAFYRGDKAGLYQLMVHPTFASRGVAQLEKGEFGISGVIPRLVTPKIAEQRLGPTGQARLQEVMLRTAYVNPKSSLGRRLAQGAGETEIAFTSRLVGGAQFLVAGAHPSRHPALRGAVISKSSVAETAVRFGLGEAVTVAGRRRFIGGELAPAFTEATGITGMVTMELAKEPGFLIESMLQDVIASSAQISRTHLKGTYRAFKRYGFGTINEQKSLAILTPSQTLLEAGLSYATKHIGGMRGGAAVRYARMTREVQAFLGVRRAIRALAQERGVPSPMRTQFLPPEMGNAPVKVGVSAWHARGYHPAIRKGFKVDPVNLMALSAQGSASARVANLLAAEGVKQGGARARQWMALPGLITGRIGRLSVTRRGRIADLAFEDVGTGLTGFQKLSARDIHPTLGTWLTGKRTVGDIRELLRSGAVPRGPILLELPGPVRLPTAGILRSAKRLGIADRPDLIERMVARQGVATHVLPLPSLEAELGRLVPKHLADAERVRLPGALRAMGSLLETAGKWGLASRFGSEASAVYQTRVQQQAAGYLDALAAHSGGHRFLSRILKPRIRTGPGGRVGGMWFPQITTGFSSEALGFGQNLIAPPAVGINELGMSVSAARHLGIRRAQAGTEELALGQFFPAVVPGTLSGYKVRVFGDQVLGPNMIVTHVANRLQAFRDLDWDQMQVVLFPSTVSKRLRRKTWRESVHRTQRFWENVPHALRAELEGKPFEQGMAGMLRRGPFGGWTEEQLIKALRQKTLSGLYYEPTMALRESALQLYGPKSYYAQQAIGVAYQFSGIKKGLTGKEEASDLFDLLRTVPEQRHGKGLKLYIDKAEEIIGKMAGQGIESDVILGLNREKGDYRKAARQLVRAATANRNPMTDPGRTLGRLASGAAPLNTGQFLETIERAGPSVRNRYLGELTGLGPVVQAPAEVARSIADINRVAQEQGAVGRAAGGIFARARQFWSEMPLPAKYAAGGLGALLGMRVVASHLFGDEPSPPSGMSISPELAARIAMQQQQGMGGAPLPPDPLVAAGIHENSRQQPYVPMSPVPARVTHPLQISPKIHISGSDTRNVDGAGLGMHLANALRTGLGPTHVGIMATEASPMNRIDLLNDRRMRKESRLHYG